MKPLSDLIHRTPWWLVVAGGLAVIIGLAVFVTPFHLIEYRKEGATPEQSRAIKREIDNTFAEGALEVARSAILTMRGATKDPERRAELDRALEELDSARAELRDAGREMARAKRDAVDTAREAAREAASAIEEARRNAEHALREAGIADGKVKAALDQSLKAAKEAEEEAKKALPKDEAAARERKRIAIGLGAGTDKPLLDIDISQADAGEKQRVEIHPGGPAAKGRGSIVIDLADTPAPPGAGAMPSPPAAPLPPLPPEVRDEIRRNVSGDLKKIGVGAGLVLLFVPLFILTIIAKFFIDRSRAAQRLADLKRKEAEYHRMSQQVTEAKLQALQAQVEPHFLYNTLANVQALTEVDPQRAHTMVGHLIQYLRNALPKMRGSISTVGQEVELVRAYLNILQMRMGRRLSFEISVPESLLATPFPPLMLPSLVENAIKHGLEPQRDGGAVIIGAQAQDGRLRLVVSDTGRGFGETVGAGVGLENIRERLRALYGETAKLTLESNAPAGVIATIEVPMDGLRAPAPGAPAAQAQPAAPKTTAGKVLSAVGTAERTWRKTLSFAFVAMVVVAAVVSGLLAFAVLTGTVPIQVGSETVTGPAGALLGAAGIAIAFVAVVLVLAVVAAIIYGLGWLFVGIAIFIPVVIVIALAPALAPVILVLLLVWWIFRKRKDAGSAPRVEPVMGAAPPAAPAVPPSPPAPPSPPPVPKEEPPAG
jgi:hypothetical protein